MDNILIKQLQTTTQTSWNVENIPAGIYYYEGFTTNSKITGGKIVVY